MPAQTWTARGRACIGVRAFAVLAFAAFLAPSAFPQKDSGDLASASLEDLMNMKVVSVSKTEEDLSRTAAAVFVITQQDIRESGATNIPDLLRMVPGVDVAQIDANTWAISIRGFNARFSNELLVLVDGRSVYTPTFGGVYWDSLAIPLEDIQRIEVVRGPGGSAWGTNAVNGVINIITKKTSDTHGALVVGGGGNTNQGFDTLQYGGNFRSTDYRAYATYFNSSYLPALGGPVGGDGWHLLQAGFRTDSQPSPKDSLTLQGDIYTAREGTPTFTYPSVTAPVAVPFEELVNLSGGFFQTSWDHKFSDRSDTTVEVSYDQYERNDQLNESRKTFDLNFQHHILAGSRNNVTYGFEYRYSISTTDGDLYLSFVPADLNTHNFGFFAQDEVAVVPDKLYATIGTHFEYNYFTQWNVMPNVRLIWTPSRDQALWASVSLAVRSPAYIDADLRATASGFTEPDGTPAIVQVVGNPRIGDEPLTAYELGYRKTFRKSLSVDFAAYYDAYTNQETDEPGTPFLQTTPAPVHIVVPITFENLMHGEAHGFELAANWKVNKRWTLSPGYAFETLHMHLDPTSKDTTSVSSAEGASPDHSAQLRSHLALPRGLSWDTSAYFADRLTDPVVPSYTRLDSQLSWQFMEKARISIVGQNLAKDRHIEFVDDTGSARTSYVKRSVFAQFVWRF
jgi:iron complex outermembrane recepter protein